jgi:hypothetical protein
MDYNFKLCAKCNETKTIDRYIMGSKVCKNCIYRDENHKEKSRLRNKTYYQRHKQEILKQQKTKYEEYKQKCLEVKLQSFVENQAETFEF